MDQLSDEKQKDEQWVEELALKEGMKRLNDREKMIIRKRFFQGKTQMEVAEEIGISQAQVSRLEKSAIKQMNKTIQDKVSPIMVRPFICNMVCAHSRGLVFI